MKELVKNNSLYFFFVFTQILVVLLGTQKDNIVGENIQLNNAIFYHFAGLLFFTLGYMPISPKVFINYSKIEKKAIVFSNKFFVLGYIFSIVGIITSIATVGSIISPTEYLTLLFSGESNLMEIKYEAGSQGLEGVFKMMNYAPVGVFLITSAFSTFFIIREDDKKRVNRLVFFSIMGCVVKVFFSLDRLTILAIVLVFFYKYFLVKKINLKYIIYIFLIFVLLSFVTASRMNGSNIFDFLVTYFKLSIANFELVIENQKTQSYGFNTFLLPLWYIMKFFGIDYQVPEPEVWIWAPAQYFASYLYIDFGLMSFLFFLIIGFFVRRIQVKAIKGSLNYISVYFIVLFVLASFASVPIIRGVEFWLLLLLAFFLCFTVKTEGQK
jgi:hypothetical protein